MKKLLVALLLSAAPLLGADEISKLEWLQGHWTSTYDGIETEEVWLAPRGGLMLGMNRGVGNKSVTFEFVRIEEKKDGIYYVASPGGKGATPFKLVEIGGSRVTFENRAHDFPQRISYRRVGESLCARVEGTTGGKEESQEWCWQRR